VVVVVVNVVEYGRMARVAANAIDDAAANAFEDE
jgi:hypothetical protein